MMKRGSAYALSVQELPLSPANGCWPEDDTVLDYGWCW
jgi:hypothetical protein